MANEEGEVLSTSQLKLKDTTLLKSSLDEDDPDYTSSSGSSSSSEDTDNETSDQQPQNPEAVRSLKGAGTGSAIRSRLAALLPELERSNRELETGDTRIIDEVDENAEQYVEMDLSLGILTERGTQNDTVEIKDHSSEEDTSDHDQAITEQRGNNHQVQPRNKVKSKSKVEELD